MEMQTRSVLAGEGSPAVAAAPVGFGAPSPVPLMQQAFSAGDGDSTNPLGDSGMSPQQPDGHTSGGLTFSYDANGVDMAPGLRNPWEVPSSNYFFPNQPEPTSFEHQRRDVALPSSVPSSSEPSPLMHFDFGTNQIVALPSTTGAEAASDAAPASSEDTRGADDAVEGLSLEPIYEGTANESVASLPVLPSRAPRRQAAQRATARISAAIATGGMYSLTENEESGSPEVTSNTDASPDNSESVEGNRNPPRETFAAVATEASQDASSDGLSSLLGLADGFGGDSSSIASSSSSSTTTTTNRAVTRSLSRRRNRDHNVSNTSDENASKPAAVSVSNRSRPAGLCERKRRANALDLRKGSQASSSKKKTGETEPGKEGGSEEKQSCCICLEEPSHFSAARVDGCDHHYCFGCIEKWADRENTCPLCKSRFTKIERIHKPPPAKRRKKGDPPSERPPRAKNSKRVKNRDQRADLNQGNPLQNLFASIEANGAVPQSIAHLIFSGLGGMNGNVGGGSGSQRSQGTSRFGPGPSDISSDSSGSFPLQPVAVPLGNFVQRLRSAAQQSNSSDSPSVSGISPSGGHFVTLESWTRGGTRISSPSPTFTDISQTAPAPEAELINPPDPLDLDVYDDDSDEDGYGSFVQRVRNLSRERQSVLDRYRYNGAPSGGPRASLESGTSSALSPVTSPPVTTPNILHSRSYAPHNNHEAGGTPDNALEIEDSDDDDDYVEVLDVAAVGASI